jgi:hypothetical protein
MFFGTSLPETVLEATGKSWFGDVIESFEIG